MGLSILQTRITIGTRTAMSNTLCGFQKKAILRGQTNQRSKVSVMNTASNNVSISLARSRDTGGGSTVWKMGRQTLTIMKTNQRRVYHVAKVLDSGSSSTVQIASAHLLRSKYFCITRVLVDTILLRLSVVETLRIASMFDHLRRGATCDDCENSSFSSVPPLAPSFLLLSLNCSDVKALSSSPASAACPPERVETAFSAGTTPQSSGCAVSGSLKTSMVVAMPSMLFPGQLSLVEPRLRPTSTAACLASSLFASLLQESLVTSSIRSTTFFSLLHLRRHKLEIVSL
mmetsp:Transcript_41636/g.114852  ORF Transcript_41636/g.114852 Transcript_41636/m.114852 type:complete len:287 (-) Transcript_41636:765-1625(-)